MNIRQMMKQAQSMQDRVQTELAAVKVEGTAGGGAVAVTMSGTKEILSCRVDKNLVDPSDLEMLQDLFVAAAREAGRKVDEEVQTRYEELAEKNTEGSLNSEEREELVSLVRANSILSVLKGEARAVLQPEAA
jgi:DNA-binding YbaB/EbfC family protein